MNLTKTFSVPMYGITAVLLLGCQLAALEPEPEASRSAEDPLNATYAIEGKGMTLQDGRWEKSIEPGSATKLRTEVFGAPAFGDLDGDGDEDVALFLVHDPGGSGTFYYVAAALNQDGRYQGTQAVLLGDRILPQDLEIRNNLILARYQDRKPQEPMSAEPRVETLLTLSLKGDRLSALEPLAAGEQVMEGWVTLGHEVRSFQGCAPGVEYWLAGESPALPEIKEEYRRARAAAKPYTPLFMLLAGSATKLPAGGFGADYPATFLASQLVAVRPAGSCLSDRIVVTAPLPGESIRSPLTIRGRARGTWFFEGDFPVVLQDRSGTVIARGFVKATGKWMTRAFVPFTGTLEFTKPKAFDRGLLVFKKDNPSDRKDLDAEMSFRVFLE